MSLMRDPYALVIIISYLAFILAGVALKGALAQYTQDVPRPLTEDAIPTSRGKQLFRWDRLWRRSDTPVLIAVIVLFWLLHRK
jgi:hypothetical protein